MNFGELPQRSYCRTARKRTVYTLLFEGETFELSRRQARGMLGSDYWRVSGPQARGARIFRKRDGQPGTIIIHRVR